MTYFAAVAAVRIQSWLARTPSLRLVRGASRALTDTTKRDSLIQAKILPTSVHPDPDTTDVAGVCVLRSDDADQIDKAVEKVLLHLQQLLPGLEWAAWRARADSYVMAYAAAHRAGVEAAAGDVAWWPRRLPLALDLPFAAACAYCSHEIAVAQITDPDGRKVAIGPDCAVRHAAGAGDFRDFADLARTGAEGHTLGRRDAANHLATVCADGNRIGDFFDTVSTLEDPALQAQLSNALDRASKEATTEAAKCCPPGGAMTHFVGGDDIFASVPAPFAWPYVEALGRIFEERFRQAVDGALEGKEAGQAVDEVKQAAAAVSLGIGIAFAHAKHPIADCRDTALAAEARAKAAVRGREGAVSWVDITVERSAGQGLAGVPVGRFVTVGRLTAEFRAPDPATLPAPYPAVVRNTSARGTLVTLLRPRAGDTSRDLAKGVADWASRVGRLADLERYLPDDTGGDPDRMIDDLRQTVDRARWWPAPAEGSAFGTTEEER